MVVPADEVFRLEKGLVDHEVRALCVLEEPRVGEGVTPDDDLYPRVLEDEAHRAVARVDRRDGADRDPVLLVHDLVDALVVELLDLDGPRNRRDLDGAGLEVPLGEFEEVLHRVPGSHLGTGPAWPPDLERLTPARRPAPRPERVDVAHVVGVQVGEEELVQHVIRDHQGRHVSHGPRTDVEQELVAVSQLSEKARSGLTVPRGGHARSAGDEPDLVLRELLGPGVVDIAIRRRTGRRGHRASGA